MARYAYNLLISFFHAQILIVFMKIIHDILLALAGDCLLMYRPTTIPPAIALEQGYYHY